MLYIADKPCSDAHIFKVYKFIGETQSLESILKKHKNKTLPHR